MLTSDAEEVDMILASKEKIKKMYVDGLSPVPVLLDVITSENRFITFLIVMEAYFFMPNHIS
jgi:hypothetical protein